MKGAGGFSLIEMVVAMGVMTTCAAATLSLTLAGQSIARRQPEAADQQQRARTTIQTLGAELALAGAGLDRGPRAGVLSWYFTPVSASPDGGLTIWYVLPGPGQAALADPLDPAATTASIDSGAVCPVAQPACAFTAATTAIVFDTAGCHDLARVDDVNAAGLVLRAGVRGCAYAAGSPIALGSVRTYRVDAASQQLLRRDEATGAVQPVMDKVAAMAVDVADSGRRVRLTLRIVSALFQLPDLVITLDVAPPNLGSG
jgi:prepilin-type N-terminal cleavage/methylation domain-containing protein